MLAGARLGGKGNWETKGGVKERVEGGSRKQEGWEEKRVSEQWEVRVECYLC